MGRQACLDLGVPPRGRRASSKSKRRLRAVLSATASILGLLSPAVASASTVDEIWPELTPEAHEAERPNANDTALIVALEHYNSLPPVPGAVRNGRDWEAYFSVTLGLPADRVKLIGVRDGAKGSGTREHILRLAESMGTKTKSGGRAWFVFIGHGAPSREDGMLVGWDATQTPDSLLDRSVYRGEVLHKLQRGGGTPVMVLDACFSGKTTEGAQLVEGLMPAIVPESHGGSVGNAVVLTAARSDQYAGPLPLAGRPAFSYLLLGAMLGWGDDGDGTVTADEAREFVDRSMDIVVSGRRQNPQLEGRGSTVLASIAATPGPDMRSMVQRIEDQNPFFGEANRIAYRVPKIEIGKIEDFAKIYMPAERAFDDAVTAGGKFLPSRDPAPIARAWCELSEVEDEAGGDGVNLYRDDATRACQEWLQYREDWGALVTSMQRDFVKLEGFMGLKNRTVSEKFALASAFLEAYGMLSEHEEIDSARAHWYSHEPAEARRARRPADSPSIERELVDAGAAVGDALDPGRRLRRGAAASFATGGVMLGAAGAGAAVYGLNVGWERELHAHVRDNGRTEQNAEEQALDAVYDQRKNVGIALMATGATLGVTGIITGAILKSKAKKAKASVSFSPAPGGVVVTGRF